MIAGCIDKMRHKACGSCERRDVCSFVWTDLLGFDAAERPRPAEHRSGAKATNPFFAFLGEVAKAVERSGKARQAAARREAAPPEGSFRREVERQVEPLLALGDIRIDAVAKALGLSRQTLYRRLKAEGTTFEQLLDGLRRRLAIKYVQGEGMAVKEAAWRLGFSDPAAFSRAFKRWRGVSPAAARSSRDA